MNLTNKEKIINTIGDNGQFYSLNELEKIAKLKPNTARTVVKAMIARESKQIEEKIVGNTKKYSFHKASVISRENQLWDLALFGKALS